MCGGWGSGWNGIIIFGIKKRKDVLKVSGKTKQNIIIAIIICIGIFGIIIYGLYAKNRDQAKYDKAINLMENREYAEASDLFYEIISYKDSKSYWKSLQRYIKYDEADQPRYEYAQKLYNEGNLEQAFSVFQDVGDYRDSSLMVAHITLELQDKMEKRIYDAAVQYYELGEYNLALEELSQLDDYEESSELKAKCENMILGEMQSSAGEQ